MLLLLYAAPLDAGLRVSTFRAEVTPPPGEPLIWVTPAARVEDPQWAKGVVVEDGKRRYVLCSVDWCGIGSSVHLQFRRAIADAAGTGISQVAVHTVHQHAAPYVDGGASDLLKTWRPGMLVMSGRFLNEVTGRIAQSVREACGRLAPFDTVGTGEAAVERVASARRIRTEDGRLVTRYSGDGKNAALAALPEGAVDRHIRALTLARGRTPLVRIYFYATHPQTFCCDGRVSADIVGAARESVEREEGVPQIYFTGCAGDVTAGKYNDGSNEAREALASRLRRGMESAVAGTRWTPAGRIRWRSVPLDLRPKENGSETERQGLSDEALFRTAQRMAFSLGPHTLDANLLEIGSAAALFLPGEPMLTFQTYALGLRPGRFLAVAGYGDISPGYLCTDEAFREGGYEPGASNAGPGTEGKVKSAIRALLVP